MESKTIIAGTIGIFVVICLIGGMLVPIIDGLTEGESESNPDAGWIRMNYDTSAAATYEVTITPGEVGITVTNGTDSQAGADDTIFYADSNVAVWLQDGYLTVLGTTDNGPLFGQFNDPASVTITRTADSVTISDGIDSYVFGVPDWAYVPWSAGTYGFFNEGDSAPQGAGHVAAVGGGFAGVYAYNDITRYAGLGLQLQTTSDGNAITGASWAKPAMMDVQSTLEPFDPSSITFDPSIIDLDPIDLGGGSSIGLMSVPTPTYSDGDWGYDIIQVDGVDKAAIVSYSGTGGGDIVIPATVGGYDVYRAGKIAPNASESGAQIFSLTSDYNVILSDGIKQIGKSAFYNDSYLKDVILPDSITEIGASCFRESGITSIKFPLNGNMAVYAYAFFICSHLDGTLVLNSVTEIYDACCQYCTSLDAVIIPESVTLIRTSAFDACTNVKDAVMASECTPSNTAFGFASTVNFLDLSNSIDYTVDRHGLNNNAVIQDNIGDSLGYLGVAFVPGGSPLGEGATAILLAVPVLVIVAVLAAAIAMYIRRPEF